jgi:hypothetical protein
MKTVFKNTQLHGTDFACQCDLEEGCDRCYGLEKNLLLQLPHGAGINDRWFIKFLTDKVVCSNTFDIIVDDGASLQCIPFSIIMPEDHNEKWFAEVPAATFGARECPIDFNVVFHTKNRYWINRNGLKDYLGETVQLCLEGK